MKTLGDSVATFTPSQLQGLTGGEYNIALPESNQKDPT